MSVAKRKLETKSTNSNTDWEERKQSAIARGEGNLAALYVDRAAGSEIWDVEGKRYIDFGTGIAVCNTGHTHPKVTEAVIEQVNRFSHTCVMVTPYDSAVRLAEKLNELSPGPSPKKSIFVTTGAEAVENAVKIARCHTGRRAVIAFDGGYHGRTNFTLGLTGKNAPYKLGFGPFPADIYRAPYPIDYHGISLEHTLEAIDKLFTCDITPEEVAAIIVEPVQGEGGFYPASDAFLKAIRDICDAHGIVMIADEIQSGFGRTGKLFCMEHSGIEPDLITMAKGMAGGYPISAVVGKADIMDAPAPGGLGGTYAGSPIGCTAALAVIDVIKEEGLVQKATHIGQVFKGRLEKLRTQYPDIIGDIRCDRGAMMAVEIVKNGNPSEPNPELTAKLVPACYENGLIVLKCGIRGNVFRFLPALNISDELIHEGLDIFESSLESVYS